MKEATVFPIEVDLFEQTFKYNPSGQINDGLSDEEDTDRSSHGAAAAPRHGSSQTAGAVHEADLLDLS